MDHASTSKRRLSSVSLPFWPDNINQSEVVWKNEQLFKTCLHICMLQLQKKSSHFHDRAELQWSGFKPFQTASHHRLGILIYIKNDRQNIKP